jgi:hypothetical protein
MSTTTSKPKSTGRSPEGSRTTSQDDEGRRVCFGPLEILEFPIILGDNPAISSGAPLSMDWKPQWTRTINIDLYEEECADKPARNTLQLSERARKRRLKKAGYTVNEIEQAAVDAKVIRDARAKSLPSTIIDVNDD